MRVYWDQASVLKQVGLFERLHLMNSSVVGRMVEALPITNYRLTNRVLNPEKFVNSLMKPCVKGRSDKVSMSDLLKDTTELNLGPIPKSPKPKSIFDYANEPVPLAPPSTTKSIFEKEEREYRPSIQVDPKRGKSVVFDDSPIDEPRRVCTRNQSSVFSDECVEEKPEMVADPRRYASSNIFGSDVEEEKPYINVDPSRHQAQFNIFGDNSEQETKQMPSVRVSNRNSSQFNIFGTENTENDSSTQNTKPYIAVDPKRHQNNFNLFESEQVVSCESETSLEDKPVRTDRHNVSSIIFG